MVLFLHFIFLGKLWLAKLVEVPQLWLQRETSLFVGAMYLKNLNLTLFVCGSRTSQLPMKHLFGYFPRSARL